MSELFDRFQKASEIETTSPEEAYSEYISILNDAKLNDASVLSRLGKIFRSLGQAQLYVDKINIFDFEKVKQYPYVKDAYLFCFYKCKIFGYEYSEDTYQNFLADAEFITNNCQQKDANQYNYNPYVLTIYKVIKIMKNKASLNYYSMLKWINKLDPNKLPSDAKNIKDENDIDREMASYKEFWYQTKSKCLEKTEEYEKCIECCDEALSIFEKFHYNYGLWFKARKLFCECKISLSDEKLENYKSIAEQNKFWYMYHKLSCLYFSNNDINNSLIFACKGLLWDKIDPGKKINLFYDIGLIFESKKKINEMKKFYACALYYRNSYGWNIPEELKYAQIQYNIDISAKPSLAKLYEIALNELILLEKLIKGVIIKTDTERKYGFVKYENNKSMHYKFFNSNNKLFYNDEVFFKIGKIKDRDDAVEVYKLKGVTNEQNFN